jgi:hypothetical protein
LEIVVNIYYGLNDETDEIVFDEDSMREEFEEKLNELLIENDFENQNDFENWWLKISNNNLVVKNKFL